jgi:hypothetical protein
MQTFFELFFIPLSIFRFFNAKTLNYHVDNQAFVRFVSPQYFQLTSVNLIIVLSKNVKIDFPFNFNSSPFFKPFGKSIFKMA